MEAHSERGQAFIEMLLVLMLIMTLIFGILQINRETHTQIKKYQYLKKEK